MKDVRGTFISVGLELEILQILNLQFRLKKYYIYENILNNSISIVNKTIQKFIIIYEQNSNEHFSSILVIVTHLSFECPIRIPLLGRLIVVLTLNHVRCITFCYFIVIIHHPVIQLSSVWHTVFQCSMFTGNTIKYVQLNKNSRLKLPFCVLRNKK